MGKAKIAGIIAGIVVAAFVGLAALGSTMPIEAKDPGKYAGLTEEQIKTVKTVEEACYMRADAAEAMYGKEYSRDLRAQCDKLVDSRIADYKD